MLRVLECWGFLPGMAGWCLVFEGVGLYVRVWVVR